MRKIGTEKTDARSEAGDSKEPMVSSAVIKRNWRPLLVMGVIMFLATFVRVFFAYGVSAGSDFALSGGTAASNNLMALDNLLSDGLVSFVNESLYYPYGSTSVAPMALTFIMYPFALVANVFLHDTTVAASFALALSGPLFGVLAIIPMYLLGKEITGKKLGGILAALFLALCPVAVQETVFSNGTGLSVVLFFSIFAVYYLIKAVKAAGLTDGARDSADRKRVNKYALVSGILLAIAGLCWTGYRALVLPVIAVMVVQTLIDRFRGRDPMPAAFMYSIVVLLGAIIPGAYFAAAGLWDAVASGITVLALFASAMCVAYSALAKKPWTLVLPVFIIIAIAFFAVMWFAVPDLFSAVVSGNSVLNSDYQGILAANKLSLSKLAAYFGWMTFWFIPVIALYRLYRIRENIVSPLYMFVLVWLLAVPIASCHTASEACAASAAFALAFALMTIWILDHVDFKAYFSGIKTGEGKAKIKRLFKPTPFIAIIMALFLVAGPNVFYAVDAGISSNQTQEINEDIGTDRFGGVGYYVPTDESWQVPDALTQLKAQSPDLKGSMAGWMDYSNDIPMYGGFDSFTDTQGNGLLELSQILLANGVDGSSTAALLLTMLKYTGFTNEVKDALLAAGLTEEDYNVLVGVSDSADYTIGEGKNAKTVRKIVTLDTETYGHMSATISDDNIKTLFLEQFLTERYQTYQISSMYEKVCQVCGKSVDHFMVSGDMIPLYYSDSFTQMALMAGYTVDSNSGAINELMTVDWMAYYTTGQVVFTYTDAMYNTLLYRMYIGMSPAEAGYGSLNEYIKALQHADVSVKMNPGYGLSNFSLTYWHVMYNPAEGADPADKEGWTEMNAVDAIALQKVSGGTINYLSGKPIIFSYADNDAGSQLITGTVTDDSAEAKGVKGIRVSAIDNNGILRATTYTGADGKFMLNVPVYDAATGDYATIVYYAASSGTTGGALLDAVKVAEGADYNITGLKADSSVDVTLRYFTEGEGVSPVTKDSGNAASFEVSFTGKNTKEVYTETLDSFPVDMKIDVYDVVVKCDGVEVYKGTFDVVNKESHNAVFEISSLKYTVVLKDVYGQCPDDIEYVKVSGNYELFAPVVDGSATFSIPKGDYTVTFWNAGHAAQLPYISTDSKLSINSERSEDVTVTPAGTVTVTGCDKSAVTVSNSIYSKTFVPEGADNKVLVPISEIGTTTYTVSCIEDGKVKAASVALTLADAQKTVDMPDFSESVKVTGTVKNAAEKTVAATVQFMYDGKVLTFASGSDGAYTAYLPKDTAFTLYATNGSDALLQNVAAFTEDGTHDVALKVAEKVDGKVGWGSIYYPYTDVTVEFSAYDGEAAPISWVFATKQYSTSNVNNSLNEFEFLLPKEASAKVTNTVTAEASDFVWYVVKDGTTESKTATETHDVKADPTRVDNFRLTSVKEIKVVIEPDMVDKLSGLKLKVGNSTDATEIVAGTTEYAFKLTGQESSVKVTLGEKKDDFRTDFHYEGDYKINPEVLAADNRVGITALIGAGEDDADLYNAIGYKSVYVKLSEGATFELTKSGRLDKITTIKEEGNVLDGYTWYQIKCEYDDMGNSVGVTMKMTFKDKVFMQNDDAVPYSTSDKTAIAVGEEGVRFGTYNGTEVSLGDVKEMVKEYTVKGFVGANGSGDMTVKSASLGLSFDVKIKDGTYSVRLLEANDWDFSYTVEAGDISYEGVKLGVQVNKDTRVNMVCDGETETVEVTDLVINDGAAYDANGIMIKVSYTIAAGEIDNESDKASIYKITYGAGWSQIGFEYNGQDVSEIYIPANGTNDHDLKVTGWYNSTQYSANDDLIVTLSGDTVYKVLFEDSFLPAPATDGQSIFVNKTKDVISDFQYGYEFTVNNLSGKSSTIGFDIKVSDGWYITVIETVGSNKVTDYLSNDTAVDGKVHFEAPVFAGLNTFAVTFTPVAEAEASGIPALNVTELKVGDFKLSTIDSEKVVIDDKTATITAEHQTTQVDSEGMTADGAGVFNEKGEMPVIVWVLVALIILGVILTIWMASKRGVFARKK